MSPSLLERLESGEGVIVAEGYLFEFEARGYLKAGSFVPEVVLEQPHLLRDLHREFVHAGSDVVLALTYYAHRHKLRLIGREDDLEKANTTALKIAREVADETGTLMAGSLSNSTIYQPDSPEIQKEIYDMMCEQVQWAVEGGADYIVAETFTDVGEAMLALKAIKEHGKGCPSVITMGFKPGPNFDDGPSLVEGIEQISKAGADVVGLNCSLGPKTMLPYLKELSTTLKVHLAALPVVYRTDENHPVFQSLNDIDEPGKTAFPVDLDAWLCSRKQIAEFSREAWKLGIRYLGLCCGNRAHFLRTMAETIGRKPPASRFSPDMSLHYSQILDDRHKHTHDWFVRKYKTVGGSE